jgi:hypothetical protein
VAIVELVGLGDSHGGRNRRASTRIGSLSDDRFSRAGGKAHDDKHGIYLDSAVTERRQGYCVSCAIGAR